MPIRKVVLWTAGHELWIVLAVALPLLFPERFPRPLLVVSLTVLGLLWPVRWLARKLITRRTAFDVPILALLLMLPASLYASVDFSMSLPKLTGILLGIAIFYAVVNTVTTWERVTWLIALLILTGVSVAGLSLVGTGWGGAKLPFVSRVYQVLPTYSHDLTRTGSFNRNQVGGTLIFFIPLILTLLFSVLIMNGKKANDQMFILPPQLQNHRYVVIALLAIGSLLLIGTLILTQSRSALLGLSMALLFLLTLRNRWTAAALIGLVVLTLAGVLWVGPTQVGQSLLDVTYEVSVEGSLNFADRQEVWSRAIYMLRDFSYAGVGLGMFEPVARALYPFPLIAPDAIIAHAHNVFLQVGLDLGLPGLVAYVGIITAFCAVAWRVGRRAPTRHMRAVGLGLLGGVVAYHVYGLTDAMALGAKPGAALWAMLGLAAVLDRCTAQSTE